MRRWISTTLVISSLALVGLRAEETPVTTVTGWFACDRCAGARLKAARIRPVGRACAQRCIAEGAKTVFINEKTRTLLAVDNPEAANGQESHHVEVTGSVDAKGRFLHVRTVRVLEAYAAQCGKE